MTDIILNDEKKLLLKNALKEAVGSKYREQSEKDLRKEIATKIKQEIELSPRQFNRLVSHAYKDDAVELNKSTTEVLDLLEELGHYQHNQ